MAEAKAITQDIALPRLQQALRLFVGRGKPFSAALLADATGIDERTIRSYLDGESGPNLEKLLRLCRALPASFANHILELAGLGGVRMLDPPPCDAPKLLAESAGFTADLAGKLADGRLDHVEREELKQTLRAHIDACEASLASLHGAS